MRKLNQYGIPRTLPIKGITIHNTSSNLSACQLYDYIENDNPYSNGCHFLVDDTEVIQVMPLEYAVFHSGKSWDFANLQTIAIEICSNQNTQKYLNGQDNAISLIKSLMQKYNLTLNDIYFHSDFSNINCPAQILSIYKNKKNFLLEVERKI